ncbi:ThiF family adenylyltransferase [Nitrospirillum sp. BR 11164]|uniref:ThiF family adenylyltransferase n=1 Tax=Nitrospirillum sp. BR 11164 TaxID=3104324 RepID=UPI002AFDEC09|nr:ThiF family adenylyltransferase [Nitrospirillum sp. BR 11164]MEA1653023.1 ThiF family adenylyltransferase [Nitrospirillum sp. BR 11164]
MTTFSFILQESHHEELTALLDSPDGVERAAYLLCGEVAITTDPWDRRAHRKFLSHEIIRISDEEVVSTSRVHITWSTASFVRALRRAQQEGLVLAVIHSHPGGKAQFSEQDDANEADLWQLARNRNGDDTALISIVTDGRGGMAGRVWLDRTAWEPFRMIRTVGNRVSLLYPDRGYGSVSEVFQRQVLAFGAALGQDLSQLRVGIVGCGGTGSATAMLLARLGVGQIALFDDDIVERTNLNRLHGARQSDADAMRAKVEVVAREIAALGLGIRALPFKAWIGDPSCRDALKSCDVVFGCTDDHDGRTLLNRFAYFYLVPVIDMGLAIEVGKEEPPRILALDGRVTVLLPGHTCLLCRSVIDPSVARAEALRRMNPAEYERQKREAYVAGEGNPAPAVVTFTTEVALMAVNELVHRMQGFRGPNGATANRVRKFHLCEDRRPGAKVNEHCPVCISKTYWGRGDVEPFLDRVG